MKKTILTLAVAAMAFSAMAQGAKAKPPTKVKCPVMRGNPVNIATATKAKMFSDYKGRRYYFCCPGCPEAFKKNPAKFAKGAQSTPIPKGKKIA